MIHLYTIATLMFLQNNTSQKILFIATRTIQFPGSVFKVCIDLIVAIVTSSIYFDVQKFSYLFENIYISNHLLINLLTKCFQTPNTNQISSTSLSPLSSLSTPAGKTLRGKTSSLICLCTSVSSSS